MSRGASRYRPKLQCKDRLAISVRFVGNPHGPHFTGPKLSAAPQFLQHCSRGCDGLSAQSCKVGAVVPLIIEQRVTPSLKEVIPHSSAPYGREHEELSVTDSRERSGDGPHLASCAGPDHNIG